MLGVKSWDSMGLRVGTLFTHFFVTAAHNGLAQVKLRASLIM